MSIDFEAYFNSKPKLKETSVDGTDWIINLTDPMRVMKEDFTEELEPCLKGRRWRIDISLEGNLAPAAIEAWDNTRNQLIKEHHALVYDPQTDQLSDKDGDQPVIFMKVNERDQRGLSLQIYFENADKVGLSEMGKVLDILEAELPEALPHRYGQFEPTQWRWDKGGRKAFLERWNSDDPPFWIGKSPASYVFSNFTFQLGYLRNEFRAGSFEFSFKSRLITDPKKLRSVMIVAEKLAKIFDAFYVGLTEDIGDCSPWWKGISPERHLQIILGPPLLEHWPEFQKLSKPLGKRHRSVGGSRVGIATISPLTALCYPTEPNGEEYASIFPFGKSDPYLV